MVMQRLSIIEQLDSHELKIQIYIDRTSIFSEEDKRVKMQSKPWLKDNKKYKKYFR